MQSLPVGIYTPVLTFFKDDEAESVDLARCAEHAVYLGKAGIKGLVIQGSTGESQFTEIILKQYFFDLADKSPIPFMIYNFPGVTNGINLSAPLLAQLSRHKNIVGTKLTCNTVSKIQYLHPKGGNVHGEFQVLTGSSEFLAGAKAAGAIGAISGLSNMFPYTLTKLHSLLNSDAADPEVLRLQSLVTKYEGIMMKSFIPGNRATMELLGFAAGHSRKPLPDATAQEIEYYKQNITEIAAEEKKLAKSASNLEL